MAITSGPALDIKWGGTILRPTGDGELEYDLLDLTLKIKQVQTATYTARVKPALVM